VAASRVSVGRRRCRRARSAPAPATQPVEVVVWHFLQAKTGEALTRS
jgi:hypothetical protein